MYVYSHGGLARDRDVAYVNEFLSFSKISYKNEGKDTGHSHIYLSLGLVETFTSSKPKPARSGWLMRP